MKLTIYLRKAAMIFAAFILLSCTIPTEAASKLTEDEVYTMAEEIGAIYNISPELLTSMAFYESSYRPGVSVGNCYGLMQVNTKYHGGRAQKLGVDIYSAYGNMMTGADYLAELFEDYGDVSLVLSKYNGQSNAEQLYAEGRISKYAQRILNFAMELEEKHGKWEIDYEEQQSPKNRLPR